MGSASWAISCSSGDETPRPWHTEVDTTGFSRLAQFARSMNAPAITPPTPWLAPKMETQEIPGFSGPPGSDRQFATVEASAPPWIRRPWRNRGTRAFGGSSRRRPALGTLLLLVSTGLGLAFGETHHWPQFRGPTGDGHHGLPLPLRWSETQNITWTTAIHGKGWSSPVIWGSQVWVTTATEDGRELSAVAVQRETGQVIHDLKLFQVETPQFAHRFNSYASPTPVIEEGRLYVSFGSPGIACVDTASGRTLWQRRDFVCNHYRGAGSSPILYGNLLIHPFDGSDRQYLAALDKTSGATVWLTDRSVDFRDLDEQGQPKMEGDLRKAFATPHVANFGGDDILLSSGAMAHYAYDPVTGAELWRVEDRSAHSASSRMAVGNGLVYILTGWSAGPLLAVLPGRAGEVLDVEVDPPPPTQLALAWRVRRSVPRKPSVTLVGELLFMVDDSGIASCLEAATGREIWRERVGGEHSASPLYAAGRLYFCNETGKTTVVAAKREFEILAENQLGDGFMASPAASDRSLFLRSRSHLYRIDERQTGPETTQP